MIRNRKSGSAGRRTLDRPFEVRNIDEKTGSFTGYGSVFGELDWYRDIVMPGAFAKSIAEHEAKGRPVPILWQHRQAEPIGVYTVLREDDYGLYVEGQLTKGVRQAEECLRLMEAKALSGLSIGFDTIRDEWDDVRMVRKLFEVSLWEISPVTFPAGDSARVQNVKSLCDMTKMSEVERYLRDAGSFHKDEAGAIISRIKAIAERGDPVEASAAKTVADALAAWQ